MTPPLRVTTWGKEGVLIAVDVGLSQAVVVFDSGSIERLDLSGLRVLPPMAPEGDFTPEETTVIRRLIVAWSATRYRLVDNDSPELQAATIGHLFSPPLHGAPLAAFLGKIGLSAPGGA